MWREKRRGLLLWAEPHTPETVAVCLQPVSGAGEGPAGCGLAGKASEVGSAHREGAGWGQGSVSGLDFGIGRHRTLFSQF